MRKLANDVLPPGISIGIREMIPSRLPKSEDIKIYQKLTEALTTQISDRPYVSFLTKRKK